MLIKEFLSEHNIHYEENVSLAQKSWIRFGGTAGFWVTPDSVEQLTDICRFLNENNVEFDLVGQTSNIFFHSTYNPQVIVSTVKVNNYEINGETITCDCGVSVVKLSKDCLSKGYAGFYGLVGLPGTVGSAIYNNASCFQCSLSSMLISADVLRLDGTIQTIDKEEFNFTHRSSAFKRKVQKGIVLRVKLKAVFASNLDNELIMSRKTVIYRREKQEQSRRILGSVFANKRMRKNLRNFIIKAAMKTLPKVTCLSQQYIQKRLTLFLLLKNLTKEYSSSSFSFVDQ